MHAFRFAQAHALAKKVTARKDVRAADWVERGHAAMSIGDVSDALASFRQALKLDEKAPVPPFEKK
jgi:cytochrome c-type biogenesis protein CcmH/NrfG